MKFKAGSIIIVALLFIGMLTLHARAQMLMYLYIRPDGSIDPPDAPIWTVDNITYIFTNHICDYEIVVERDNIVVDGAGYTLLTSLGPGADHPKGISLSGRSNVTIKNIEIKEYWYGIFLHESPNNTISGNNITNNEYGIMLSESPNNTISGNKATNNEYGIYLSQSSNNTISGNNVTANTHYGIVLSSSSNNILRDNSMLNNGYNFRVSGPSLSDFVNDVDPSNTVDGKPIYYWINRRDATVPLDAGYLALVNCTSITVQNLDLSKNYQGTVLVYTTNSTITKSNITNNSLGIQFLLSSNNTISGNNVTANTKYGIVLSSSSNNTISGNNVTGNEYGIVLSGSSNNSIYHNHFINTNQADTYNSVNVWDDGYPSGGNYWSDYTGVDEKNGPNQNQPGSDGIGDTPYVIDANNRDRYPLMPTIEDVTPPTTTDNYDGLWHTADFNINLTAWDDFAGVAETYYKINDGARQNISAHGQPLIITESANNTLEYWSIDKAGNEEIPHKILTGIKLDKTPPSGYILINNDDANTTTLNVTLTLNASDITSGLSQMRLSNDGPNWTAWETYTTSKAWNLSSGEGTKIVYAQYKDIAGLVSQAYNDTIILRFDVDSPTTTISLTGVEGNNGWFTSNVTVTLSATDDISGVEKTEYSFDNITWTIYTTPFNITNEGNTIIYYKSTDKAGNVETIKTETIKIDKTAPSGSIIINNDDAYTTSTSVTLTLSATDATSGVAEMRFSNDNLTWSDWETYATSKSWILLTEDGTKTVYYQIKDNAGLISETYSDTIILDTSPPTGSITINDDSTYTTTTTVTLTLSATDDASGISEMRFSNDNVTYTEWQAYTTSKPWTLQNGDGEKTVYVQFKDQAGLVSTYLDIIVLDTTQPTGTITIAEDANYTNSTSVTLTLSAYDTTSGVAQMRFSHDNITWMPWEDYDVSKAWDLPTGDGEKTVYVQFKDNAGLISQSYADAIILDTTPPSGSISIAEGSTYTNTTLVTLRLTATDATSGVAEMRFSNDNTTYADWQPYAESKFWTLQEGDGPKTVYVQFKDYAGLISTYLDTIVLDTVQPIGSITIAEGATYTNSTLVTLTLSADDTTSDVAQIRFSNNNVTWEPWEAYSTSKAWALTTGDATKTVYVQFMDNAGLISPSYQDSIILDTTKPVANAGGDQTVPQDTLVTFDSSASTDENGIASYTWTFTDATPQTLSGQNPTYTFTTPGKYTVTLKVTDPVGNSATDTVTITVLDINKPIANAGTDQTVDEDTLVTFDASASSDNVDIISYKWTFTDAGTLQTLEGINSTYTFQTPGIYTITLNVTDAAGNHATDTITITVLDITKPVANAGANRTVNEDTPISLDGLASSDNIAITDYTWTFTDVAAKTLTEEKPTYTFNTPGVYTITLNVTDAAGNWATDTIVLMVLDITNPIADAGQDKTLHDGETAAFDAGTSSDNVGIVSYEWNFGDGTTGTGINTTHTYTEPGTYTVTLTVKDAAGNTDTCLITATVLRTWSFLLWIVGATAAVLIGITLAIIIVLHKKTKISTTSLTKK